MILYNSLSGKKEEFISNVKGKVLMYTCGPTVYNYAHIGNLRTYIMEDVLEKSLKYLGYDVKRAMNITDVGHLQNDSDNGKDKMVEGAKSVYTSIVKKIKLIDPNEGDLNKEVIAKYRSKFSEALSNDLNTSLAITVLFDMLKDNISGKEKAFLLNDFDTVLDLDLLSYLNSDKNENIDKNLLEFINSKIEERKEAKKNKDFALADFIRKELEIKGIILKDTREGTEYEII